jgi:protein SCO1/2
VCSQAVLDAPPELSRIDVIEHISEDIPLDLEFVGEKRDTVVLGEYFGQGKPVVLVLGYYTCPMLCNLVMNGLSDAVRELDWLPGQEFLILSVSIDPRETNLIAGAKKQNYVEYIGREGVSNGWYFLVGRESQSKMLADAVGFQYYWDEQREQYAHPAVITVLTEKGVISRYFYGIEFNPRDLKLALLEASEGKVGTTIDRIILYCYHYDPDAGGYVLFARNVMSLGGATTLVVLVVLIGSLFLRERRKRRRVRGLAPENMNVASG